MMAGTKNSRLLKGMRIFSESVFTTYFSDKLFKHSDLCLGVRRDIKEGVNVVLGACTDRSTKWVLQGVNIKPDQNQNLCLSADITTGGGLTIGKCDHSLKQTFKFELKDIKA